MLPKLRDGLRALTERIRSAVVLKDSLLEEILRDLRKTLLEADVAPDLVEQLLERLRKQVRTKPPPGVGKKEQVIKALYDELVNLLGGEVEIELRPKRVLLVGLFGSGKTTLAAKLARFYQKRNLSVGLVCCDVTREAAYDQLKQLANQVSVAFYGERESRDSASIARNAMEKLRNKDVLIFDSSGRNALDSEMITEIKRLHAFIRPDETILVIPADLGQAAREQASAFAKALPITHVAVTKLDATAKGGGALAACAATGAKIAFITTGEKPDDLELYSPKHFVARLLGFPDLETLLAKLKETRAPELAEKALKEEEFTLEDFIDQFQELRKAGGIAKLLDMLGLGIKLPVEVLELQEEKLKRWKYALDSMTEEERKNPEVINASRIRRIAKGSGVSEAEIREMLSAYRQVKRMLKMLKPGKLRMVRGLGDLFKLLRPK